MKMNPIALVMLGVLLAPGPSHGAFAGEVAIVVNKENPSEGVSFRELVKIFKQEKQFWESGKKVYLLMRETGAPEKVVILRKLYTMKDDEELKKFWLEKVFRNEIASFPKTLSSDEAIKRFVRQVPNAIGFIDAASVDDRVKTLRIDGKLPGEAGYALTDSF